MPMPTDPKPRPERDDQRGLTMLLLGIIALLALFLASFAVHEYLI